MVGKGIFLNTKGDHSSVEAFFLQMIFDSNQKQVNNTNTRTSCEVYYIIINLIYKLSNLFKVNNKDTRMASLTYFWSLHC